MNEFFDIIILAFVQGLTEFLPVSSSGHLVLAGRLIGHEKAGNITEVVLHAGTLIAVLLFFRARLISIASGLIRKDPGTRRYVGALAAGSIPVVVLFLLLGGNIESMFDQPLWAAICLCLTGLLLLSLRLSQTGTKSLDTGSGLLIGIAQALALLPGISRSGTTIVTARHLGIDPEKAAEFSFLLSLPAVFGAILIKSVALFNGSETISLTLSATGILVSAAVGYAALAALLKIIRRGKLWIFGVYCLLAGISAVIVLKF